MLWLEAEPDDACRPAPQPGNINEKAHDDDAPAIARGDAGFPKMRMAGAGEAKPAICSEEILIQGTAITGVPTLMR